MYEIVSTRGDVAISTAFPIESTMIEYKVLKEIENNPQHTQRSLAGNLGISLGKMNYILGGLIEKGIVRAKRLRDEPGSIRWHYLLTPEGIQEKISMTRQYLARRKAEYAALEGEIAELEREVGGKSGSVGPG